ncbi:allophanate hydrolase subunit 1 [Corynebacterium sp. sy017]|uniref:5-oxoprolinase subunit B family protein n=1 Tax=unclassified Corynebacterium TaxID=2624378 RepID=UPI0011846FC0|nr:MULTISPECIES: allophanate hydrolase subunit 1 [unclassified Corynebacterium]MBP3088291.1 allophanate hydrolase subunit 1 [Corynebacterium sp. sy017]QDZ41748.1 allophanate hydrolase subunit 1 [Corynebacterium sp. sy039]TSD91615.1 allophanate hydrolase subunit 1 [Corynebacterium sp. SY003]
MSDTGAPISRITFGGDEFVFVEVSDEMSLAANFRVTAIAKQIHKLREQRAAKHLHGQSGIIDICPANASILIRIDPDIFHPHDMVATIRSIEKELDDDATIIDTRIIEIPVWYNDPYTAEIVTKFRQGYHQDPTKTDLEYAAAINNFSDTADFIKAHYSSPWLVSMVGFVAGLPFMFQLVDRQEQLEVPKYLSPRTDTPELTVGHGGCFACIYSVRGAGGYQMFGIAASPIYDPEQKLPDFTESMVLFQPGDIVKFRPVSKQEYQEIKTQIAAGTFRYRKRSVQFNAVEALEDPRKLNEKLIGVLYAD